MNKRTTPETDAEHAQFKMGGFTLDFCQKLERERDEARDAAAKWESLFDAMERAGVEQARRADENREWALKAERERDEAIADRDILRIDAQREAEHHDRMVGELERVYQERDEAREKLARIESLLLDPHAVFLNFLHGKIAKLDWAKLEHIHGPHPARVECDEAREERDRYKRMWSESRMETVEATK